MKDVVFIIIRLKEDKVLESSRYCLNWVIVFENGLKKFCWWMIMYKIGGKCFKMDSNGYSVKNWIILFKIGWEC